MQVLEHLEHAHVRDTAGAAAGQHQADARPIGRGRLGGGCGNSVVPHADRYQRANPAKSRTMWPHVGVRFLTGTPDVDADRVERVGGAVVGAAGLETHSQHESIKLPSQPFANVL